MTAISATNSATNTINHSTTEHNANQTEQNSSVQGSEYISNESSQSQTDTSSTSSDSSDFATVLNDMLANQQAQSVAVAAASAAASFPPLGTSTMPGMGMAPGTLPPGFDFGFNDPLMQQTPLNATSSTDSSAEQMVQAMLMMMMTMMQGGGGGDMSMMQMMMSSLIPMLENASQNSNNNPQMNVPFMNSVSGHFGAAANSVGGMSTSSVASFGSPILPLNVSLAATPVITSTIFDRHPARYRAVIDQFQVESAERYRPGRDGFTYCNIFVLDVVRAMNAHIPHLGAINMCNWLGTTGRQYGWREVDAATAQAHANMGRPAVTSAGSIGHVQMVVPSTVPFNPQRGVSIAQAGRINTNYAPISTIYGGDVLHTRIRYFIHD